MVKKPSQEEIAKRIFEKYDAMKTSFELTPAKIKLRIINLLQRNRFDDIEKKTLCLYFDISGNKDLLVQIKKSSSDELIPIKQFIKGKNPSKKIRKLKLLELADILVSKELDAPEINFKYINQLKENAKQSYLSSKDFTQIRISLKDTDLHSLQMDEYYIQLSYIDKKDAVKRDTFIGLEKESRKINKYSTSKVAYDSFFRDYISTELLNKSDKVIITGNPGIGKSTYAKWLCYNWAKDYEKKHSTRTPIFLELAKINFKKKFPLLTYISEEYLGDSNTNLVDLKKELYENANQFVLILDGYDEIVLDKQITLDKALSSLGIKTNYILLSRPYGLLDQKIESTAYFHIDGFDKDGIKLYVDKLIEKFTENQLTSKSLFESVENNFFLKEHVHKPLLLSHITMMYIEDEGENTRLKSITSLYSLHNEIIYKYESHYLSKYKKKIVVKEKKQITNFAYDLEIQKKIIASSVSLNQHENKVVSLICKLGIGVKKPLILNEWNFNFESLVIQEFLAAVKLKQQINPEAFIYLSSDRYFWNLSVILFSIINEDTTSNLSQDIINLIEMKSDDDIAPYQFDYFYVLLSEANEELINDYFQEEQLDDLIDYYYRSTLIESSYLLARDSLKKIYSKFSLSVKRKNYSIIIDEIKANLLIEDKQSDLDDHIGLFSELAELSLAYLNSVFVEEIIDIIISLLEDYIAIKDAYAKKNKILEETFPEYSKAYSIESLIDELLRIISKTNNLIISSLTSKTNFIKANAPDTLKAKIYQLFGGDFNNIYGVREVLSQDQIVFRNAKHKINPKKTIEIIDKYVSEVYEISIHMSTSEISNNLKNYAEETTVLIANWLKENDDLFSENEFDEFEKFENSIFLIIQSLIYFDKIDYYDLIFDLIYDYGFGFSARINIPNIKNIIVYIESKIEATIQNDTINFNQFKKIVSFCENTENAQFEFYELKQSYWKIFSFILEKNKSLFKDFNHEEILLNDSTIDKQPYIDFILVFRKLAMSNRDKSYLLEKIFSNELQSLRFVKYDITFTLLTSNFSFFKTGYWDFIFDLLEETNWDGGYVYELIKSDRLFDFKANYIHILKILQNLTNKIKDNTCNNIIENPYVLFKFINNTIMNLKGFKSSEIDDVIVLAEEILLTPKLLNFYIKNGGIDVNHLPYILLSYYTQSSNSIFAKYWAKKVLKDYTSTKFDISSKLNYFFSNEKGIIEERLKLNLKRALGEDFFIELLMFNKKELYHNITFDKEEFETLLIT